MAMTIKESTEIHVLPILDCVSSDYGKIEQAFSGGGFSNAYQSAFFSLTAIVQWQNMRQSMTSFFHSVETSTRRLTALPKC
jgi:hypothetical protein